MVKHPQTPNQRNAALRKDLLRQLGGAIQEGQLLSLPNKKTGHYSGARRLEDGTLTISVYAPDEYSEGKTRHLPEQLTLRNQEKVDVRYARIEKPRVMTQAERFVYEEEKRRIRELKSKN